MSQKGSDLRALSTTIYRYEMVYMDVVIQLMVLLSSYIVH